MSDIDKAIEEILQELVVNYLEDTKPSQLTDMQIPEAKEAISKLIAQKELEARQEMALKFIEKLDEANVPMEVNVPDVPPNHVVPIGTVTGEYWHDIHLALKYIRETTEEALQNSKDKGEE